MRKKNMTEDTSKKKLLVEPVIHNIESEKVIPEVITINISDSLALKKKSRSTKPKAK